MDVDYYGGIFCFAFGRAGGGNTANYIDLQFGGGVLTAGVDFFPPLRLNGDVLETRLFLLSLSKPAFAKYAAGKKLPSP